jgi:hypothetical protein
MRFRDQAQQQAVCDRILRLAHYNLETVRSELLHMGDVARVRRARTLYDLALALWDGDGQPAVDNIVELDRDTRTMIGDLLAELGVADDGRIHRWLASTAGLVGRGADRQPVASAAVLVDSSTADILDPRQSNPDENE